MRTFISLFFLSFVLHATAQDWALLNPAYRYNYSLGGTDTITNQVFVTQIDTLENLPARAPQTILPDIEDPIAAIIENEPDLPTGSASPAAGGMR